MLPKCVAARAMATRPRTPITIRSALYSSARHRIASDGSPNSITSCYWHQQAVSAGMVWQAIPDFRVVLRPKGNVKEHCTRNQAA